MTAEPTICSLAVERMAAPLEVPGVLELPDRCAMLVASARASRRRVAIGTICGKNKRLQAQDLLEAYVGAFDHLGGLGGISLDEFRKFRGR
jgi:hypothetical protein